MIEILIFYIEINKVKEYINELNENICKWFKPFKWIENSFHIILSHSYTKPI